MHSMTIALGLTLVAFPALANAPADIADLVGARAAGAESEIQARGYENFRDNTWWNAATGTCVRVHVSNGRYARIDTLRPRDCGHVTGGGSAAQGAPADIADLIGARAAGAESEIQARGYESFRNNTWWNAATRTCARVHVSNGRYARIDTLRPRDCGQSGATGSGSSGGAPGGEVPGAAQSACMKRADEFQNAASGSSVVDGASRSGPNWVLRMATGPYRSTCTVTGAGKVVSMDPGG